MSTMKQLAVPATNNSAFHNLVAQSRSLHKQLAHHDTAICMAIDALRAGGNNKTVSDMHHTNLQVLQAAFQTIAHQLTQVNNELRTFGVTTLTL